MKIDTKLKVAFVRVAKAVSTISLLASATLPLQLHAELNTSDGGWVAGMVSSGSAPFDHLDPSAGDEYVRTHDSVTYRVGFTTVNGADTNARIILRAGALTLPNTHIGPNLETVGQFNIIDIPTSCMNISQSPLANSPANGISGISADGQTLFCAQPSPTNGNNLDFVYQINGKAPNGAKLSAPSISFKSDQTQSAPAPEPLEGSSGLQQFYGLPELTIRAEPRWNLRVEHISNGKFIPASGPNQEDGFVLGWSVGTMATGSRRGLEALSNTYKFKINFDNSDAPNARAVDWNINNPDYAQTNFSFSGAKAHSGCGNWNNTALIDSTYSRPQDIGTQGSGATNEVANGGNCTLETTNQNPSVANYKVQGTDFQLTHFPTKQGTNAAAPTINWKNENSNNEWWVSNKTILIWVPETDLEVNVTESFTISGSIHGESITAQPNVEPYSTDNGTTQTVRKSISATLSEVHTPPVWSNPFNLDYASRDPRVNGDSITNQVAPNQVVADRLGIYNLGTSTFPAGYFCDKVDNTRLSFFDITGPQYTVSGSYKKDPKTGIVTRHASGPEFPIKWELGIIKNTQNGTWSSYSSTGSGYDKPNTSGSNQSDAHCEDSSANWYSSVAELIAAEGQAGLNKVTRIRGSYSQLPTRGIIFSFIPQIANKNFLFDSTDLPSSTSAGGPLTAGESTIDSVATHQLIWETNEPRVFTNGVGKTSDAIQVFQTEYASVIKTSESHNPSGSLANIGESVSYTLTANLSTTGETHLTDVAVWDVLPDYINYISGSSMLGGASITDPVCSDSSLPTSLFPSTDGVPAGSIANGFKACVWELSNQKVSKATIGDRSADLPTLTYKATIGFNTPSNTQLLTSAAVTSTNNLIPLPVYNGNDNGFNCNSNEACSFSNWLLNAQATPGIVLNKDVASSTVKLDGTIDYTINYGAVGQALSATRIIDIFPHNADSRSPASVFSGGLELIQAVENPVEDAMLGTSADDNFIALYSKQTPTAIDPDPHHSSHRVDGLGSNSATQSNWCTVAQFGTASCPSDLSESTAVMLLPDGANGASASMPEGHSYRVELSFKTSGNAAGDVYSNSFTADSPSLTARRPSSNTVTSTVKSPDLVLSKSVTPDTAALGTDVSFEIVIKNNNSEETSPIYESPAATIRVVDALPEGLTLATATPTADGWDCSASTGNTVDCSYTGAYPLGTGAAVGAPLVFSATVDDTVADNAWLKNKATVTLTGVAESDTSNNEDEAWVRAQRDVDLSLTKTAQSATAVQSESISFTLKALVGADGGRAINGPITVTDNLPTGLSISAATDVSGSDWDCSASTAPSAVSCTYTGSYPVAVGSQVGGDIVINASVEGSAVVGPLSNTATVTIAGEKNTSNNSGTATFDVVAALASVQGTVFVDNNFDGALDTNDSKLAGVALTLCSVAESPCTAANTLASRTTDSNGNYQFDDVGLGDFYVVQSQPAGFGSSTDNIVKVTRTGTTDVTGADFGETLGKLSGYVYADMDQDGARAASGENGVGKPVEVVLRGTTVDHISGADKAVEIRVAVDATSGEYLIEGIPAPKAGTTYSLTQDPGAVDGFANGASTVGELNAAGSASATPGTADSANSQITGIGFSPATSAELAPSINAQNYNFAEIPQAGISGRVYLDSDANGGNSAGDSGLEGVTLVLCRTDEQPCSAANTVDTTQTASDGGYLFNAVAAGSYFVQQLQPVGYGSVTSNSVPVTRTGNQALSSVDFGERGASIAGQVFIDVDRSGNRGPNDTDYSQGTAEITLSGTTLNGDAITLTRTVDAAGRYYFSDLAAPDGSGYSLSLNASSVSQPYYAAAAHEGAIALANGGSGTAGSASDLSVGGIAWPVGSDITAGNIATGLGYDFSVMTGVNVGGRVLRDTNGNGTGNTSTDPEDLPTEGVSITLCRSANAPCATDDIVEQVVTDADGNYQFGDVVPGSYWVMEEQPATLGNGPGASDIIALEVEQSALENVDFLDRAGTLSGTVFRDNNANGSNDGEPGLQGISVTLTGTDIDGNSIERTVQTDENGNYQLTDLPAPNAAGYTLTESNEPEGTRDGTALPGNTVDALGVSTGPSGTLSSPDSISAIQLSAGGTGDSFDFSELPATASVSGSVWRDKDSDRTYSNNESAVPGWTVQLLHIDPVDGGSTVVAEQVTGNDGKYHFTGQTPGDYQIVFRSPTKDADGNPVVWGTPVNGEHGAPVANSNAKIGEGIIQRITLKADEAIEQQSLPLDPSGVVYDSDKRTPVPGTVVRIVGPAGFDPATQLLGGLAAATQTTASTGEYQFLLLGNAPAGEYSLEVVPPAGYDYASTVIPAEAGVFTPPNVATEVYAMVPSELAPVQGAPTTYYTRFNLTPGVSSGVVHNHIPLDPQTEAVLYVTKQADRRTAEVGDSLKYTVHMYNRGTAAAPALAVEDTLPLGFKYIDGTAKLTTSDTDDQVIDDPTGAPGPSLLFSLPGTLAAGEELQLSYRVRIGVGGDRGDGINRATGITGSLRSATAEARVTVTGGVFSDEACLTGRVFVDCNNDHLQNGEELGIPGVRLYMEDGRYLVSDVEGKYSSCDLTPQTHILKVDRMTLPRGSRLTTSSNRNLGDANSLFVDMKNGELHRADFIVGSCTSMVLDQVRARRSNGEVLQAQIEANGAASLSQQSNAQGVNRGTVSANQALVRARPAQAANSPLAHAQDSPQAGQNIQPGAPFVANQSAANDSDLSWDDADLSAIELQVSEDTALADGVSAVEITALLHDDAGRRLTGRQLVTLVADGGHLWLPGSETSEHGVRPSDLDPAAPGVQAWAHDGQLRVSLLAPDQPKKVTLQAIAGDRDASVQIDFVPALRDWIAAGLVEGIVRLNDKGGLSTGSAGNGLFERELQAWQSSFNGDKGSAAGRVAFFVKGTIKGKYLLTASFDSEKDDDARILQDIEPEQLYPVFGDASIKGFEAQSSSKLFVRISEGKHYLLYGDFQSENGSADLGANNRTLTGGRLHLENERGLLDIFAANDTLRQQVEELAPNGTSGPYGIKGQAVENTEVVELIVRDSNLRTRVLERRQLSRLSDYSFDSITGRLLFKEPVSSTDGDGNPQTIRVSYEQDGGGDASLAAGIRAELQASEAVRIGGSYSYNALDLVTSDQLSELASVDIAVAINDWLNLRAEVAQSTTLAADGSGEYTGDAARVELQAGSDAGSWSAVLHAVQSDVDFNNSNASVDAGRGEIGLRLNAAISETFSLQSEIQRSTDESTDAEIDSAYLGLKLRPREGFAVAAGIRHLRDNGLGLINSASIESNGSVYNGSGLSNAGAGLFSTGESLLSAVDGDSLETTTLVLGADWAVTEKLSLGAEVEDSFDGDESWRATAKAGWKLNDTQTLQARYETQTGLGSDVDRRQKSRAFVFGLTRNFDEDGSNFTELRLRDSVGNREAHLAYGIRNGFDMGSGFRGMASAEQVAILDGDGSTATSGALGVSHTGGENWKGTGRIEARRLHDNEATAEDDRADSWLANVSIARKLDRSWTALAKYIALGSDDKSTAGDQSQQSIQVGAAYRPVDNNKVAVLAKLERRRERNSELATPESRDLWVASVNSNWHPTRAWWLGARLAAKDVDESLEGVQDDYQASLAGARITYDITERTDVGLMGSYRYSPDGNTKDWAAGIEMGYAVQTNLWLSLGYNWGGFSDQDLSGSDYTQRGWYIRLRYKFDEDLFNGASPSVNRSLARSTNQQESK